jgi:hypothetical protein
MTASFRQQPAQLIQNKYAMPVGTNSLIDANKFIWDKRDENCSLCKHGLKSTLPKFVEGKTYSVNVICTCVPYYQSKEANGTGVVMYKGRREMWKKGIRPESVITEERIREQQTRAAYTRQEQTKARLNVNNRVSNNKYEIAPATAEELKEAGVTAAELTPKFSQEIAKENIGIQKSLQNSVRAEQKVMQRDKQGHLVFLPLSMAARIGAQPVTPAATPVVAKKAESSLPLSPDPNPVALTTPLSNTVTPIVAKSVKPIVATTVPVAQVPKGQEPVTPGLVKRRGRPAGSKNKATKVV